MLEGGGESAAVHLGPSSVRRSCVPRGLRRKQLLNPDRIDPDGDEGSAHHAVRNRPGGDEQGGGEAAGERDGTDHNPDGSSRDRGQLDGCMEQRAMRRRGDRVVQEQSRGQLDAGGLL